MGYDTLALCSLIRNDNINNGKSNNYVIVAYDSYEEESIKELETVLDDCPLKQGDITIKLK